MSNETGHLEADFTLLKSQFAGIRKRQATRYRCSLATLGYLIFNDGQPRQEVWIVNLSETGIAFYLDHSLEPGTALTLKLSGQGVATKVMSAKVIHSTSDPAKDDWLIGCEFGEKLEAELLDALL